MRNRRPSVQSVSIAKPRQSYPRQTIYFMAPNRPYEHPIQISAAIKIAAINTSDAAAPDGAFSNLGLGKNSE